MLAKNKPDSRSLRHGKVAQECELMNGPDPMQGWTRKSPESLPSSPMWAILALFCRQADTLRLREPFEPVLMMASSESVKLHCTFPFSSP